MSNTGAFLFTFVPLGILRDKIRTVKIYLFVVKITGWNPAYLRTRIVKLWVPV